MQDSTTEKSCQCLRAGLPFFVQSLARGCLVPRPPKFFLAAKAFRVTWSMRKCEFVFPSRSPRIRHRNELTERDWENAVQGLGKALILGFIFSTVFL